MVENILYALEIKLTNTEREKETEALDDLYWVSLLYCKGAKCGEFHGTYGTYGTYEWDNETIG